MENYREIERLFKNILQEKDRFKISGASTVICEKLKGSNFKEECGGQRTPNLIDQTQDLLSIYTINFSEIIKLKIQGHMLKVLNCLEVRLS